MEAMPSVEALLKTLVSLIVVVDPLGALPVFLSLTAAMTEPQRRKIARDATGAMFLILLISAVGGRIILELFGIHLASIKAAGGILFLLMGIEMLNARPSRSRQTPEEEEEAHQKPNIAIVPLALPYLAGPGAIGSVILLADRGPTWPNLPVVIGMLGVVAFAAWLTLRLADPIGKRLGVSGRQILERIMGLILVAIAVEFLVGGVRDLWLGKG
jgi:multiple antibiotic resistance protein